MSLEKTFGVLRFEIKRDDNDQDFGGIYTSRCHHDEVRSYMSNSPHIFAHPEPYRDMLSDMEEDDFCGFISPQQLFDWFYPKDVMFFSRVGGVFLSQYETDIAPRVGQMQTLFKKNESTLKHRCQLGCMLGQHQKDMEEE